MNKFIGVGRLTKDPEVRYTQGQNPTCVASFTTALDRRFKGNSDQTADFPACVAFGKTAEFIEKYFRKGMRIGFEGRIQTRSYENREGRKVYVTEIVLEQVEFVESKGQQATPAKNSNKQSSDPLDGFMNIPDGIDDMELPFN